MATLEKASKALLGTERRAALVRALQEADSPVTGAALAALVGVSRQVVVQDIALLRSQGHAISAAKAGYSLERSGKAVRLVKTRHDVEQSADELYAIVNLGGEVIDVTVNHRVYGKLNAPLDIKTRHDVEQFMEDIHSGKSFPLCMVTSGYHFHRIAAESEEVLDEIECVLKEKGLLAEVLPYEAGVI